jgi:hypothetical protein
LKQAFQPLLAPGRHVMDISQLQSLAVTRFPNSARRPQMFSELQRLIADLNAISVTAELWIDGSFMTEKEEPDDIDLSFSPWVSALEKLDLPVQVAVFNGLNGGKKYSPWLDTYVCVRFPQDDPRKGADKTNYWSEKWGKGWDDWLKGYAVIKIGETDVGHRLFT